MAEIAESAKEGLLALVVGAGLQVMAAVFAEDAERLAGRKASATLAAPGYRHGQRGGSGYLVRRMPVTRPRVRASDGSGELYLPSYDLLPSTGVLSRLALEKMLAGLSSRRCGPGPQFGASLSRTNGRADHHAGRRGLAVCPADDDEPPGLIAQIRPASNSRWPAPHHLPRRRTGPRPPSGPRPATGSRVTTVSAHRL
jgi:hypothetical protein